MAEPAAPPPVPNPAATSLDVLARLATAKLEAAGVDWRPVAAAQGLPLDDEPVDGARIPTSREHAFIAAAAVAARDPLFAWRLGDVDMRAFGLAGYAIHNASTVSEALNTMGALAQSVCEAAHFRVVVDGDMASFVYASSDVRQNSLFVVHLALNVLRDLIGPQFAPARVGIALTERERLPLLARVIAAPLTSDLPFSFVSFPARHLRTRVAGAEGRLAETLRPYWQREMASRAKRPAIVRSRIEAAVIQCLHQGTPTPEILAGMLNLGRSQLATEMAMVGGCRAVVDEVRHRLAVDLIQNTNLTMASIAGQLGYSEPGALNHAFHRWTGHAPSLDREQSTLTASVTPD